jgi:hypothetical protein
VIAKKKNVPFLVTFILFAVTQLRKSSGTLMAKKMNVPFLENGDDCAGAGGQTDARGYAFAYRPARRPADPGKV